jgi:mRNA-degrading endonuclease RelE of RelBE toxin-antitoxin system
MPRFSARWLEIALEQYNALPPASQRQVEARIEQLLERPEGPREAYDSRSAQWTTTYGGGVGLILYAVVHEHQRVLILRLV